MENYNFDNKNLLKLIKKSFKNKKIRNMLIENAMIFNDEIIDIRVVKLINDHPIKSFKETMFNLLGHKKLKTNVLIYISSLGYYPEAFYNVLIEKCGQYLSHDALTSFLDYNIKYIMEVDEFIESIHYINAISIQQKEKILDYLKKNKIID